MLWAKSDILADFEHIVHDRLSEYARITGTWRGHSGQHRYDRGLAGSVVAEETANKNPPQQHSANSTQANPYTERKCVWEHRAQVRVGWDSLHLKI